MTPGHCTLAEGQRSRTPSVFDDPLRLCCVQQVRSFEALGIMMAEQEYDKIYKYLHCKQYPERISKDQKRNFRRKCLNNYKIQKGILYYHAKGSAEWKQVIASKKEQDRIIKACHALPQGNANAGSDLQWRQ